MINEKAQKFYSKREWGGFLEVVSPLQKVILVALGKGGEKAESLSSRIFASANTISHQIVNLRKSGVIERVESGVYKIADSDLASYCDRLRLKEVVELEKEEAMVKVEREIYAVAVKLFESLEHLDRIAGNGHHIAQKIASNAEKLVEDRWK